MREKFYIDGHILGILLGLDKEEDIVDAYDTYMKRVERIIGNAVNSFIEESGMSEEDKKKFKTEFENSYLKNDQNSENKALDFKLSDPRLQNKVSGLILEFNKFIYDTYLKNLSSEKKKQLDDYVLELDKVMGDGTKLILDIIKISQNKLEPEESVDASPSKINLISEV